MMKSIIVIIVYVTTAFGKGLPGAKYFWWKILNLEDNLSDFIAESQKQWVHYQMNFDSQFFSIVFLQFILLAIHNNEHELNVSVNLYLGIFLELI